MRLKIGYDRSKEPKEYEFREMTLDEAKKLNCGDRVWFLALDGTARGVKINGRPKTWKTRPNEILVPTKYGMYQYARIEYDGGWKHNPLLIAMVETAMYP